MKLVSFSVQSGDSRIGALQDNDCVLDFSADASLPTEMVAFLKGGDETLAKAKALITNIDANKSYLLPITSVTMVAPIQDCQKVVCVGMNYSDHCEEQGMPIPSEPMIFSKFASAICSSGTEIPASKMITEELDYEVELVIVIGKKCKEVTKDQAWDYIAGYMTGNDLSARDWQLKRNGGQWLIGKTFDYTAPIGPCLTTCDDLSSQGLDINNLSMKTTLNDVTVQDSTTKNMVFKVNDCVAWISKFITLVPGDIIFTGTPPGVGCFRKPTPLWIKPGDVCTVEIEGLGKVTNKFT